MVSAASKNKTIAYQDLQNFMAPEVPPNGMRTTRRRN